MKQSELADRVGIRQQTLYRTEAGMILAPRAETLIKIAMELGVQPSDLLAIPHARKRRARPTRKGAA